MNHSALLLEYLNNFVCFQQDNYYSQFKFQPKIDQTSRLLGSSTNLRELYMVSLLGYVLVLSEFVPPLTA